MSHPFDKYSFLIGLLRWIIDFVQCSNSLKLVYRHHKNLMKNLEKTYPDFHKEFCLSDWINTFYAPFESFPETRRRSDVDLMSHQWTLRERWWKISTWRHHNHHQDDLIRWFNLHFPLKHKKSNENLKIQFWSQRNKKKYYTNKKDNKNYDV